MKYGKCHFLIVEKGAPYNKGDRIQIDEKGAVIGRSWKTDTPGVAFDSPYISRKHVLITWNGECFLLKDLQSKHGTQVNGREIEPDTPVEINDGDRITLAKGIVVLEYKKAGDFDDRTITLTNFLPQDWDGVLIDPELREVYINGELLNFSGKEKDLLFFLYLNRNRAVSYDEIKRELWPERKAEKDMVPDVGSDEITALVYRLRKRLGKYGQKVVTVARYGIRLEG